MPIEDSYTPRYVEDLDDVPVTGPDDYSDSDKRLALYHAEARLELDVNEGKQIDQSNVIEAHRSAAAYLTTHILTHAAEEPSDITLGDMYRTDTSDYSSHFEDTYLELVENLQESGAGGHGNFTQSVNPGDAY
jgi:hypothetical protein